MKKTLPLKLTDKEISVLVDHVLTDISFRSGGTFYKSKDEGEIFDKKDAKLYSKRYRKLSVLTLIKKIFRLSHGQAPVTKMNPSKVVPSTLEINPRPA